jgi:iron-sulfur cluster assembly protein
MALDEPGKDDQIFDEKGIKFLIDKDIFEQAKPINVDFVDNPQGSGFRLTSSLSAAGGGCGSSCSSC